MLSVVELVKIPDLLAVSVLSEVASIGEVSVQRLLAKCLSVSLKLWLRLPLHILHNERKLFQAAVVDLLLVAIGRLFG